MIEIVRNYHLLYKCTEDILSVIKPTEEDKNKRLGAVQEIVNSISSIDPFRGNFRLFGYCGVIPHHLEITTDPDIYWGRSYVIV
jgi:hypothetical protein